MSLSEYAIDRLGDVGPVTQNWVHNLPMMQQTVLLTAIRGPDGLPKYGAHKMLLRWFRRCVLLSAMDRRVLGTPWETGGGSFTGPSVALENAGYANAETEEDGWKKMGILADEYLRELDAVPHHFQMHFLHAAQIVGFKHPDRIIRAWWERMYLVLVKDLHLHPESKDEMDRRLGDDRGQWLAANNQATTD